MRLFEGKKGLVFGIANDRSIAWAITQELHAQGAELGFTHLPDPDPERRKAEKRLRKLADPLGPKLVMPCDAQKDDDLDAVFAEAEKSMGQLDFVLHSMAYAPIDELKGRALFEGARGAKPVDKSMIARATSATISTTRPRPHVARPSASRPMGIVSSAASTTERPSPGTLNSSCATSALPGRQG